MDGLTYTRDNEGCELKAYPDPLTKGPPWTIGFGHTGPEVKPGLVCQQDNAIDWSLLDYQRATQVICIFTGTSCFDQMDEVRQAALVDLAFNIGEHRLSKFKTFFELVRDREWTLAACDLEQTAYARELPHRAAKNAKMIELGQWLPLDNPDAWWVEKENVNA